MSHAAPAIVTVKSLPVIALQGVRVVTSELLAQIYGTERGAARHAKMLDTDQAWEVFERLEDAYFRPAAPPPVRPG
jgi:hypothetical protein